MTEFQADQTAITANSSLKSSLKTMVQAKSCAVLWFGEILDRGLFRELGYSSMNQYAEVELGFSRSRTGDFMILCRKLKKLPKVKAQVENGALEYTKARVIAGVADKKNEGAWLDAAELEQAQCDCQANEPGKRNTSAIPPATRRKVLVRDRHHCQSPCCSNTHYLEIHHKTPRSRGGTNDTENLTTLCSACHRLLHAKGHSHVGASRVEYCCEVEIGRQSVVRYNRFDDVEFEGDLTVYEYRTAAGLVPGSLNDGETLKKVRNFWVIPPSDPESTEQSKYFLFFMCPSEDTADCTSGRLFSFYWENGSLVMHRAVGIWLIM